MATTINSYSVSLALDAKDYIRNSALSRSETSSLTRQINQARTPADKYERSVKLLDKAVMRGAISQRTYNRLLAEQKQRLSAATSKTKGLVAAVGRLALAYVGVRSVVGVAGKSLRLAANAEDAQIQFKVLLKSADAAKNVLADIRQFAATTPFQFPELRESGQLLLAFGFKANELIDTMDMLGNISAATGSNIKELAELYGKMRVQNTIYSEDLNQLTGRGIVVLDKLASKFGVTTDQVKKLASESKVKFADIRAAMEELAGDDYMGLIEERSKTINGQWSTLKDNISEVGKEIGEKMLPPMKQLIEKTSTWTRDFKAGLNLIFKGPQVVGGELNERFKEMEFNIEWMNKQVELRRQGKETMRTSGSEGAGMAKLQNLDPLGFGKGVAEGLAGGMGGIADHFGGMFQQLGNTVVWSNDMASEKMVKAVTEDPAIASLEAGTQEAYAFLTQGMKESESAQKLLIQEQKKADAEARKQRENQYTVLNKIHDVLSANGWAKARQ